jgi:hypothetical protein
MDVEHLDKWNIDLFLFVFDLGGNCNKLDTMYIDGDSHPHDDHVLYFHNLNNISNNNKSSFQFNDEHMRTLSPEYSLQYPSPSLISGVEHSNS